MTAQKVVLVDDEKLARERLKRMVDEHADYQVVAEAENGQKAIELVVEHEPDILLMDIRMPGMDGLEASKHVAQLENPPAIIFCTAYDEYAIKAFDVQAVGYVLKPVRKPQLLEAMARAQKLNNLQLAAINTANDETENDEDVRAHLSVNTHVGLELIPVEGISHFKADQKYVTAFCGGREVVVDESLKSLEEEFGAQFLRIHRNCLVAVAAIDALQRSPTGKSHIKLRGVDELLAVSRRHLAQVKTLLKSL